MSLQQITIVHLKTMKLSLVLLLGLLGANPAEVAGEDSCACKAENNFKIDCDDTGYQLEAMNFIKTNGCAQDCSSQACEINYYIVQAHHDFCPEEKIPKIIEDDFHDFDVQCEHCEIHRSHVKGAPDCQAAVCDKQVGNAAYAAMEMKNCRINCLTNQECIDHFLTLRVEHDLCDDHSILTHAAEEGLHDMEEACPGIACNVPEGMDNQLICQKDDHDDHDHGGGPIEWAGVFPTNDNLHKWSMQSIDGEYADPSMRLVFFATADLSEEPIHNFEEAAAALIVGDSCTVVEDGDSMTLVPGTTGACFELHVGSSDHSEYDVNSSGIRGVVVYAQHVPVEFERDQHFFQNSDGEDIEPVAAEGGGEGGGHDGHDHGSPSSGASIATIAVSVASTLLGSIKMLA